MDRLGYTEIWANKFGYYKRKDFSLIKSYEKIKTNYQYVYILLQITT